MVVCSADHGLQADIVYVIEATAINGAYINDLKTNYIMPSLEYFSQGNVEEINYMTENANCLYGIVTYHAADCLPKPSSDAFGPFSSPSKFVSLLEKLELIGGKSESHANIAEGLATALNCFEELALKRNANGGNTVQKHCILICHSPPYLLPVMESYNYSGKTTEQLATILQENEINLSIISPRKIPSLYKLFEKAGGDLSISQTKNYAKDPRHLVLLKGFSLKERPLTPPSGPVTSSATPNQMAANNPIQMTSLPSPIANNDSPIPGGQQGVNPNMMGANPNAPPNQVGPNNVFRPNNPQAINMQQNIMVNQVRPAMMANQQFSNQPMQAPPGYNQAIGIGMGNRAPARWIIPQQQPRPTFMQNNPQNNPNQGSALIAQLTTPPNSLPNSVNQFNQLNNTVQMNAQQQQQQQLQNAQQQQQQIRMSLLTSQHQQQQLAQQQQQAQMNQPQGQLSAAASAQQQMVQQQQQNLQNMQQQNLQQQSMQQQQQQNIQTTMGNVNQMNQGVPPNVQQNVGNVSVSSVAAQMQQQNANQQQAANQAIAAQQGQQGPGPNMQMNNTGRQTIWQGVLEWIEKAKVLPDNQKVTKQVQCSVSASVKDGEPELKADGWPLKLIMQLMPKQLIGNIGGAYLKNSKSVFFHPIPCDSLDSLTKVMSSGFAGCVHFTSAPNPTTCDIKVLILLYTAEKRAYLGFIPNDQVAFVDRLRKVIQQQKSTHMMRQGAGPNMNPQAGQLGAPNQMPNTSTPQTGAQQGMMMSQANTMSMGGGQLTQNVVTSTSQQAPNMPGPGMINPNMPGGPIQQRMRMPMPNQQQPPPNQTMAGGNPPGGMMGAPNRPQGQPFANQLEAERQANLDKINQLKQTLEVAQQQEQQYKNQLERISHMKTQQLQEALQLAQQQEMQYKMLDQQRMSNQGNPQVGPGQQQRMMRPGPVQITNNPGLRTLLQQQPQYRPPIMGQLNQMGGHMQQGGPRPPMGQQMGQGQGNNQFLY